MALGQDVFPALKQPCPVWVTLNVLQQNWCVFVPNINQTRFAKSVSFAILRFRERDPKVRNEASVSMTNNYHKSIALANFRQACFDWEVSSRAKKLHGVVLKLKPPDSIKHTFPLNAQICVGATKKTVNGLLTALGNEQSSG
jgi:hypothetical protein